MENYNFIQNVKLTLAVIIVSSLFFSACGYIESDEAKFIKAQEYLVNGDPGSAEVLVKKILQADANNSSARFLLGKIQFAKYRLPDAIDSFKKAKYSGYQGEELFSYWVKALMYLGKYEEINDVFQDPNFADVATMPAALLLNGDSLLLQKKHDAAKEKYDAYYRKTNNEAVNCLSKVKLFSAKNENEKAINQSEICEKQYLGVEGYDENLNRYIRAISYVNKKELKKALNELEAIKAKYEDKIDIHLRLQSSLLLVKLYLLTKQTKKAAELADTLLPIVQHPDLVYAKAMAAMVDGDYIEAERLHLDILKVLPDYAPSLMEMMKLKYIQGNTEQAKYYAGKLDVGTGSSSLVDQIDAIEAAKLYQKGDFDDLIEQLSGVDSNKNVKTKVILALAYAKKDDKANMWKTYDEIASQLSDKLQKDLVKARLHIEIGEYADAEQIYQVYAKDNNVRVILAMSGLYVKTKKYQNAELMLTKALSLEKDNKLIVTLLAGLYDITGDKNKLYMLLQKKIHETNDIEYKIMLAKSYFRNKDFSDALKMAEDIRKQDDRNLAAHVISAGCYIQLKNYQEAENSFKTAVSISPDYLQGYIMLSKLAVQQSKLVEAETYLQQALSRKSDYLPAMVAMIDFYLGQNNSQKAIEYAKEVKASISDKKHGSILLARAYQKSGDEKDALEQYKQALQEDSSDIKIALEIYRLSSKTSDESSSVESLNKWLEDSAKPENYLVAAGYAMSLEKFDMAQRYYEKYLISDEANYIALNNLSWLYMEKGELKKALDYAQKALLLAPDTPEIQDSVGWLLVRNNKFNEAEPYLLQAQNKLANHPSVNYHLAYLYYKMNKHDKSKYYLQLTEGKNFPEQHEASSLAEKLK